MSRLPGFGFVITAGGTARYWYAGKDGIQRWSDNDKPVDPEQDFIAAMSAGLRPIIAPLALQSNNTDIAQTQWAYADIADVESSLKGVCDDRR